MTTWFKKPYIIEGYSKVTEGETEDKKVYNSEDLYAYLAEDESCQEAYNSFLNKVLNATQKEFLPIYRMSDGEFIFCLERIAQHSLNGKEIVKNFLRNIKYLLLATINKKKTDVPVDYLDAIKNIFKNNYFKTCYGEQYTSTESKQIEKHYIHMLREIATKGMLAIDYTDRPDNEEHQSLFAKMMPWFNRNNIKHTKQNYIPFYFIYVLLSSKDSYRFFENKNVLIITSYDDNKEANIRQSLLDRKAKRVDFLGISSNKAMFDKIDITKINNDIDIVLLGAGIGAANILVQLEDLKTVCIDSGFMLNILNDHSLAGNRIFTKPYDYQL